MEKSKDQGANLVNLRAAKLTIRSTFTHLVRPELSFRNYTPTDEELKKNTSIATPDDIKNTVEQETRNITKEALEEAERMHKEEIVGGLLRSLSFSAHPFTDSYTNRIFSAWHRSALIGI